MSAKFEELEKLNDQIIKLDLMIEDNPVINDRKQYIKIVDEYNRIRKSLDFSYGKYNEKYVIRLFLCLKQELDYLYSNYKKTVEFNSSAMRRL